MHMLAVIHQWEITFKIKHLCTSIFICRRVFVLLDVLPEKNVEHNGGTLHQINRSVCITTQIVMSQTISLARFAVQDLFATKTLFPTPGRFIGHISL